MSNSAHLALRDAVVVALRSSALLVDAVVTPNRRRPMAQNVDLQVNVSLGESKALEGTIGVTDWSTRIHVECSSRQSVADSAEARADAAFTATFEVLMTPGVVADSVLVTPVAALWAEDEVDTTVGVVHGVFEVAHRTAANSIAG